MFRLLASNTCTEPAFNDHCTWYSRVNWGMQGFTRVYKGLQGFRGVCKGIHRYTGVYKGIEGVYIYKVHIHILRTLQEVLHEALTPHMIRVASELHHNVPATSIFSKFPRGACPQTSLAGSRMQRHKQRLCRRRSHSLPTSQLESSVHTIE